MSSTRAMLASAALALVLPGCGNDSYSVEVAFADGLAPQSAEVIDLVLLEACPGAAEVQSGTLPLDDVVQSLTLDRTQTEHPRFAAVEPGTYGLYARAVDASCTVLAASCVPVSLEDDGNATLSITLAPSAPLRACAATDLCSAGRCTPTGDKVATRVGAGRAHSCALFTNGEIWCWGDNAFGQLGQGDSIAHDAPVRLPGDHVWQKLSVGWDHACAIDDGGRLFCWGRGDDGRLGHAEGGTLLPAQVGARQDWQVISAGARSTCGRADEDAYCWGANEAGQLGVGDTEPRTNPTEVVIDNFEKYGIAAGGTDTTGHMAIVRHETVSLIVLPLGRRFDVYTSGGGVAGGDRVAPGKVLELVDEQTQLSAGGEHTCLLSASRVYCGGSNAYRQLGRDDTTSPLPVDGEDDWTQVSAGARHTCGRRGTMLWCWGDNGAAQCAGGESIASGPTQVSDSEGWTWVSSGVSHSCAIEGGLVYCWGSNEDNRSGLGVDAAGQMAPLDFIDFPPS